MERFIYIVKYWNHSYNLGVFSKRKLAEEYIKKTIYDEEIVEDEEAYEDYREDYQIETCRIRRSSRI